MKFQILFLFSSFLEPFFFKFDSFYFFIFLFQPLLLHSDLSFNFLSLNFSFSLSPLNLKSFSFLLLMIVFSNLFNFSDHQFIQNFFLHLPDIFCSSKWLIWVFLQQFLNFFILILLQLFTQLQNISSQTVFHALFFKYLFDDLSMLFSLKA